MEEVNTQKKEPFFTKKDLIQLGILVLVLILVRTFIFSPVKVDGESMAPTLKNKEYLFSVKVAPIERFDIVNFHSPVEKGKDYIKRVVGVPGDYVEYIDDELFINGKKVAEPYLDKYKEKYADAGTPLTEDFSMKEDLGIEKIPEGQYLLLGDNRRNSFDGRRFGTVKKGEIVGVTKFRFYPLNKIGTPKPVK